MREDSGAGSSSPLPGEGQAERQLQVPEQRASGVGHPHKWEALMLHGHGQVSIPLYLFLPFLGNLEYMHCEIHSVGRYIVLGMETKCSPLNGTALSGLKRICCVPVIIGCRKKPSCL